MSDWDGPGLSRAFLLAALATGACGIWYFWRDPLPRLTVAATQGRVAADNASSAAAQDGARASAPGEATWFEGNQEALRDAVAGPAEPQLLPLPAAGRAGLPGFAAAPVPASVRAQAASSRRARDSARPGPSADAPDAGTAGSPRKRSADTSMAGSDASSTRSGQQSSERVVMEWVKSSASRPRRDPEGPQPADSSAKAVSRSAAEGGAASSRRSSSAPAGSPAPGARVRAARPRPALARNLLGKGPLTPPAGKVSVPKENPWRRLHPPRRGPSGEPLEMEAATPADIEAAEPPADKDLLACGHKGPHWHEDAGRSFWHDGRVWGTTEKGKWAWLERDAGRWWIWPGPQEPPLVWHENHWWARAQGMWFLLHDGEPWGYQYLQEWRQEGLLHASGAQMVYSADGARVGLVVPGEGVLVFDAETGTPLGTIPESARPKRPQPRAPAATQPLP